MAAAEDPEGAGPWRRRGNEALARGELAEARRCYEAAVAADPRDLPARLNLGFVALELGDARASMQSLEPAVSLAESDTDLRHEVHLVLGNAWQALEQPDAAVESYRAALAVRPGFDEAVKALVRLLLALGRKGEAIDLLRGPQAAASQPSTRAMLLAQALHADDRPDEALRALDALLATEPRHAGALESAGNLLLELGHPRDALARFRLALEDHPGDADLRWNAAVAHLLLGEFALGWEAHEARWHSTGFGQVLPAALRELPAWDGSTPLAGRRIVLSSEQGLGDSIHFARYVPWVAQEAAHVFLRVRPELVPLLQGFGDNVGLLGMDDALPAFDQHAPLMSLPRAYATRRAGVPAGVPYLHADPAHVAAWQARWPRSGRPRVGFANAGNPQHPNDHRRSLPLAMLRAAMEDTGCEFVNLQPHVRPADRDALDRWPGVLDAGPWLRDLGETAALLETLDLVVSVDTSVAHLAGALGRPTWILLPFAPDWRWLLERNDSPWYPTVRLHRQHRRLDWTPVLAQIRADLQQLAARS